jgi:hypothetical protein
VDQVADAVSRGWAMVDHPKVSAYKDHLEIIWTVYSLPPEMMPVSIYTAHSDDWGTTWTTPAGIDEAFIPWNQVITAHEREYHRLWLESADGVQYLWHQFSTDHGRTWGLPENILTTNDEIAGITAIVDPARRIHLLFTTQGISQNALLNHWVWQNGQWISSESLNLGWEQTIQTGSLAATVTEDGTIGIIYASKSVDNANESTKYHLNFAMRHIDLPSPEMENTSSATGAPTPSHPTPTTTPAQQTPLTATPTSSNLADQVPPASVESRSGLGPGGVIALGFLLIAIFTGLFLRYWRNR